jgi:hypothetical protein
MIKISGKVKQIFETKVFGNFEKRTFWVEEVAEKYPNTWQLELWKDDCNMADSFSEGDYITCYIDIKGSAFQKKDGSGESVMNTLKCWNVEKDGKTFKAIKTSPSVSQ